MKKQTYILEGKEKNQEATAEMVKMLVPEKEENSLPIFTQKKILASDENGEVEASDYGINDLLIKVGNGWILASEYANGFHAPLGNNAIDLSIQTDQKTVPTGMNSFNSGQNNQTTGILSSALGGFRNINSGTLSASLNGSYNENSGERTTSIAGDYCKNIATYAISLGGFYNHQVNQFQIGAGAFSTIDTETVVSKQIVFSFGNGTSESDRKNAITLLRNGLLTIDATKEMIAANSNPKTVITKEFLNDKNEIKEADGLNTIKFLRRTQAQYDAIATKDANTLYIITDAI